MISFAKWFRTNNDGTQTELAPVRVTFYLSVEDLECCFIKWTFPVSKSDLREYTAKEVEEAIRDQLKDGLERAYYWSESYTGGEEITEDEIAAWGKKQVAKATTGL